MGFNPHLSTKSPKNTVFEIGSTTKLFTWTAAMQLYEQGKLDLKEDIRTYLPEDFKLPLQFEKPVTMLDLMNHQAGFDDYLIGLFSKKDEIIPLEEALYENQVEQVAEPGTMVSYSNYGAGLAGYLVQCITGQPEDEYIKEHIFQPAGMEHMVVNPDLSGEDWIREHKSLAYSGTGGKLLEDNWSYVSMYPAGAGNGTLEDLARFGIALCREDEAPVLFSGKKGIEDLFSTSYTANPEVAGVSHGFFQYEGEKPVYWHNGGTEHFSTFLACVPEEDYVIAAFANTDAGIQLIQKLGFQTVQKKEAKIETPEENLPSTKEVEGSYNDFRQVHHGISQLAYLFNTNLEVKAVNEKQVSINGDLYTQIKPYLYQDVETGTKGYFTVKDGKVQKYSDMVEYARVPFGTKAKQVISWIVMGLFLVFLLLLLVSGLIWLVKKITRSWKKEKERSVRGKAGISQSKTGIVLIGSVLLWGGMAANIACICSKVLSWEHFSAIRPFIFLNIVLGILIFPCAIMVVKFQAVRKDEVQICSRISRWIYYGYAGTSVLLLLVMLWWGVFQFMR